MRTTRIAPAFAFASILGAAAACGPAATTAADDDDCPPATAASCDDGDACTLDEPAGCEGECRHAPVDACAHGDGCCPAGCNAVTDDDCPAVCGNDVLEGGETCDPPGSCPVACDDGDACTADALVGLASTCTAACAMTPVSACATGDGCCPSGCDLTLDADCPPFALDPPFADDYQLVDLGPAMGVPEPYGCLLVHPDDPSSLLLGGAANGPAGMLYRVPLARNAEGHIVGLAGPGEVFAKAEYNDGGIDIGPGGVWFLARWPVNGLGQLVPGTGAEKIVDLGAVGVASSPGGVAFVPASHPGAGGFKLLSWPGGQWYDAVLAPDGLGTYDVVSATLRATVGGGPEGMTYVPIGSPEVPNPSIVVSEWSIGEVAIYETDAAGDPLVMTRRRFIRGLDGVEGATIDPVSGDFLFSTFGFSADGVSGDRVVVVHGFVPPPPIP